MRGGDRLFQGTFRLLVAMVFFLGTASLSGGSVEARNYNYEILKKSQALKFKGKFTVKGGGEPTSQLRSLDEIVAFSNTKAYDYPDYEPGECKQFAKIIVHEVAGNHGMPANSCIGACSGGYYANFSKPITEVVPGDILHCSMGSGVWHTMMAMMSPEYDKNGKPDRIYVLDSNFVSHYTVGLHYHDLTRYPTYGFSKGWDYTLSFVDQWNSAGSDKIITLAPGETVDVKLYWKNEAREPWTNDPAEPTNIYLAASGATIAPAKAPPTRHSPFASGWIAADWKVAYPQEALIEEGGTATFAFKLKAPATPGEYQEYFYPYHVSGGWVPNRSTQLKPLLLTILVSDAEPVEAGEGAANEAIRQVFAKVWTVTAKELGPGTGQVLAAKSKPTGANGFYQIFKNGSIQYHADGPLAGQAFALYGNYYEKWRKLGFASSPLGFPTGNRTAAESSFKSNGAYQTFEGGIILWDQADPVALYGEVHEKWDEFAAAAGPLGFPVADRVSDESASGTKFVYQRFEGGSIQVSGDQAHIVYGDFYLAWGKAGYATWAGLPTSDRYSCDAGECQDFVGGTIHGSAGEARFVSTTHPRNLKAQAAAEGPAKAGGSVNLTWENRTVAEGVRVYRKAFQSYRASSAKAPPRSDLFQEMPADSGELIAVLPPESTAYTDQTAAVGVPYLYTVRAFNLLAESPGSNEAAVNAGLDKGPWPMFHHDGRHTGQSPYQGTGGPFEKWKLKTGGALAASPVLGQDGTVYVGSDDGSLWAVNPNGTKKWSYAAGQAVASTPAVTTEGHLVFGSGNGSVYALASDKTLLWQYETGYAVTSSAAVNPDGTVFIGSGDSHLYAVSADGTPQWDYPTGGAVKSSPAVGIDGTVYFGSEDKSLYALDGTGVLQWSAQTGGAIVSSPALGSDETVYIGSLDGSLYAYRAWGDCLWTYASGGAITSTPAIGLDGTIYFGSADDYLYALTPDGDLKWRFKTGGDITSSPALSADGTIYVGSNDSYLYALSSTGTVKWRFKTGGGIASSPAIGPDGTIHIGSSDSTLYAIGIPTNKGGIFGRVADVVTDAPITAAVISTFAGSTQSAPDGTFSLLLDPGIYDVDAAKTGYETTTIPNVEVTAGAGTEVLMRLTTPGLLSIVSAPLPPAELDEPYNGAIRAKGGTPPYQFAIEGGVLPSGLGLDPKTGNIAGTPGETGNRTFTVKVVDAVGTPAEKQFTLDVTNPLKLVTISPLPSGTRSTAYFLDFAASGGTFPYTFAKGSGNWPPGLTLAPDGDFSGTPTQSNAFQFIVEVTDAAGRFAKKTFQMAITEPLLITTSQLSDGLVGEAYNQTLLASGGVVPYQWELYQGILPAGLELDRDSGVLASTPTEPTYGTVVIAASDAGGRVAYRDYTLRVVPPLAINTSALPNALVGEAYSEAIDLEGGVPPYQFTKTGELPEGLNLNKKTGIISGTPLSEQLTNFKITVTDNTWPTARSASRTLSLRTTAELTVTEPSAVLPRAKLGVTINPITLKASGGPSPMLWSATGGYLPEGIKLDKEQGQLSGTPQDHGDFLFTLQVKDAEGGTATKEFFWHVSESLTIATGAIADASKGVPFPFALEAEGGILPYQWRITSGSLPTGLELNTTTGTIYGTPTKKETRSFTVEVNDSDSPAQTTRKAFTMQVLDELSLVTEDVPNARLEVPYRAVIRAGLGTAPYHWRVASGLLPPGLVPVDGPEVGLIEGTPTAGGVYPFTIEVSDSGTPVQKASRAYVLEVFGEVQITTTTLACAYRGVPYSDSIAADGGAPPYNWQLTDGSLPLGLTLNSTSGHLSGVTSLALGQSTVFKVRVADSGCPTGVDEQEFKIVVLKPVAISTSLLPKARQGSSYRTPLKGTGGIKPYQWSIETGNLPKGLKLNATTGVLVGTPKKSGTFNFTVKLSDAAPCRNTVVKAFTLEVLSSE